MAMAMLDDSGAGPSGSGNPNGQGMGAGPSVNNNVGAGGGYRYSTAYEDSAHPQHSQPQLQQRQSFVGNSDNSRTPRYPSPSRNNGGGGRDSFRASSYDHLPLSLGNLSNLSLTGQMPAQGGWDEMSAPTRPYDDVGVYGGAGGSGSNGRQSPYGGRASPAQYTGRQSPLFTPNLPPRLSQGNLRAQSDGYAFPVAGAVPNNPTSSSPGQRRSVLERTNTEDTLGAGGRLSFPSTNDPSPLGVSSSDPDTIIEEQMRYSRSSAYLNHPPERPSSLSISNTPPHAPRHPGVPISGLPPSTPYASLASSPLDTMNMSGIRTSVVSQPQTPIYNHTNNSGNVNINNSNGGPSNQRPMSGSTGYIAGGPSGSSPGPTQSQSQIITTMGQNQTTAGTPSPTPQSQPPPSVQQAQGRQSPYLSHSPNSYPLSQSPQQLQAQSQAQAQASRSISPARASGSGVRQPSPPSQVSGQTTSSIPPLPSSLSARTPSPASASQQRKQPQAYVPYQPPLPTQAPQRPPVPPEEVCVECAMRDQDMADVDVTSPGVWERESDIAYADRLAQEDELRAAGLPPSEDPPPIVERGDRLTERHLKIWMSVNPKEPTSRQQTLNAYVKSQRALLEAEALAQAQAAAEDRMREARLRDAQLRRSAYDAPMSAGIDEYGSLGQGYPQSSRHHHAQARSLSMPLSSTAVGSSAGASAGGAGSRNTTLLENGMIVEQIDVKKEEREERERRKREERRERDASRARKSSRGSGGASVYSVPLPGSGPTPRMPTQDGAGLRPGQRTSQFSLGSRPASVLSTPLNATNERERPGLPRAYSQYSLADSAITGPPQGVPQSGLVSPSPRRSRFFGFGRSRDSLAMSGMSGSMADMHMGNIDSRVATEATHGVGYYPQYAQQQQPGGQARWSTMPQEQEQEYLAEEKAAKKKRGLLKLWKIVTGTNKPRQNQQQAQQAYQQGTRSKSLERRGGYEGEGDGEGELAPPPPLSYLMARSGGAGEPRQAGGHSPLAPGPPQSPQTAGAVPNRRPDSIIDGEMAQLAINAAFGPGGSYNNTDADTISRGSIYAGSISHPGQVQRDKSLPPLPPEARLSPPLGGPGGARTPSDSGRGSSSTSTYFDMRPEAQAQAVSGGYLAAPHRTVGPEGRRQSFNGVSTTRPESVVQTLPSSANYNRTGFPIGSPGGQQQGYNQGYNHQGFDQGTARARGDTVGQVPTQYQPQGYSQDPYAEFGRVQSRPTSTLDYQSTNEAGGTLTGPKKRRSRFGLTSLFGKKSGSGGSGGGGGSGPVAFPVQQDLGYQNHHAQSQGQGQGQEQGQAYGSMRGYPASYQGEYAPYSQAQAYPTSSSEDAYYGGAPAPSQAQGRPMSSYQQQQGGVRMNANGGGRMSVASRKAVEELVDQDREFVAYRYPSAVEREAYEREIRR